MKRKAKVKWTAAQIKAHTKKILEVVEKQKAENKEENFTGIPADEIKKKFKRINSPMIVFQSWNGTTPGGNVNYNLGIYNPGLTQDFWLSPMFRSVRAM